MKHLCRRFVYAATVAATLGSCSGNSPEPQAEIIVDYAKKGAEVNPKMYGVFFEEINHSGDGALYGELIRNRNFEEGVIPSGTVYKDGYAVAPHSPSYGDGRIHDWKTRWDKDSLEMIGWSVEGDAKHSIVGDKPLHRNTPNHMLLNMKGESTSLINEGYWGISAVKGDNYDLRFYLNPESYKGSVKAEILSADNKVLASKDFEVEPGSGWTEYTGVLTPDATDGKAKFRLLFNAPGNVRVDYVSLFPEKTFKNRKNGMRADVAQMLADLNPGFVRWPGGCIVEGATYDNRVKWKNTIGDPMQRPSEWILWNYHCTWGFGFHEFLQFCEDIGADPMFVANVGLSCDFRNGDFTTDLAPVLQDIEDAIEYAQGDVTTTWGAKRAEAGHPEPFKMKYIELGNEQWADMYADRYNQLYKVLKEKYPEITFICTFGLNNRLDLLDKVDMIDPHWYVNPLFFYENDHLFDSVERGKYDVYVGEYAVNQGVGPGNMDAALAEAAFISGMERNGDLVKIASYAPLIENSNHRDWATNLIWAKSDSVVGRASYYVQQMFSHNVPTYNLETIMTEMLPSAVEGFLGVSGNNIVDQYRNFKATDAEGNVLAESVDFSEFEQVKPDSTKMDRRMRMPVANLLKSVNFKGGSIEFEACAVREGRPSWRNPERIDSVTVYPTLIFGADNANNNSFSLNLGSMGRQSRINVIRKIDGDYSRGNGNGADFDMEPGKWYKVKVDFSADGHLTCYIDGQQVLSQEVELLTKHYALAGYDETTGETIIKVVNGNDAPFTADLRLNCTKVDSKGTVITLSSESRTDENSFAEAKKIVPVTSECDKFGKYFKYTFEPNSFTILRIPTSQE
ncbi:MAG: alpha-L-arabinofuranosidase [Muribaculum sp.]|nr:alpha-L-arabinofuranosidase [Muribaculum sp.]